MTARISKSVSRSHVTSNAEVVTPSPTLMPLQPPPSDANIPSPPTDFVAAPGGEYLGARPRKLELGALPTAVENLSAFTDYERVLGSTAPPLADVTQAFDVARQWSNMRTKASAWDAYCNQQEGLAWNTLRAHMDRLRPAFALATAGNPRLATSHPGLASLLSAKKTIARKGGVSRRLNAQAIAEGKPAAHGAVGKRRLRAAEKAALAAEKAALTAAQAPPPATATPVVVNAAPAPTASSPPSNGASAATTNGVLASPLNGAAH